MSPRPLKDPEAERARALLAERDALRRVRRAAKAADAARAKLEAAMRDARDAGVALRPLAEASGLSVEWTRRLSAPELGEPGSIDRTAIERELEAGS